MPTDADKACGNQDCNTESIASLGGLHPQFPPTGWITGAPGVAAALREHRRPGGSQQAARGHMGRKGTHGPQGDTWAARKHMGNAR